jgi:hypothetical protein
METMSYLLDHRKNSEEFIADKLLHHQVLVWNYASISTAFNGSVFKNISETLLKMVENDKVQRFAFRLGKEAQSIVDAYLRRGTDEGDKLKQLITEKIFRGQLDINMKSPEIWMNFFHHLYTHNLTALVPIEVTTIEEYGESSVSLIDPSKKTVLIQYYDQRPAIPQDAQTYQLVHVDHEIGFVDTTFNRLSYVLNFLLASRTDFGIDLSPVAPFYNDDIQMMSREDWQHMAIEALKSSIGAGLVTPEMISGIKTYAAGASTFDQFKFYDGLMVSLPGDDSGGEDLLGDIPDDPEENPADEDIEEALERALVPVRLRQRTMETADSALLSKGGIDFNTDKVNLEVQNNGQDVQFLIDPKQLAELQNAPGFVPVIFNIQPLKDVRSFLEAKI